MTAISEQFETDASFRKFASRQHMRSGAKVLSRAVSSFFGATLMASAIGLWLVPSDFIDAEMMLIRLVLSLVMFASGAVLMQNGRNRTSTEIEIDAKQSEVRVIERGEDGIGRLTQVISYEDIGHVETRGGKITLKDHKDVLMLQMPLGQIENLAEIRAAIAPLQAKAA